MAPTALAPRTGAAVHLQRGQSVRISQPAGAQVVDTWAFGPPPPPPPPPPPSSSSPHPTLFTYLSAAHTRAALGKLTVSAPDTLYSSARRALLALAADTSAGVHDTLFPACDAARYTQLGVGGWHASCAENLRAALGALATAECDADRQSMWSAAMRHAATRVGQGWVPQPVNLFMNVPVGEVKAGRGGEMGLELPVEKEGGFVVLRAEVECVVVMSACPMDLNKTNGYECRGAAYEVLEAVSLVMTGSRRCEKRGWCKDTVN